jgi:mannosylglycerate hydrolase
MKCVLVSHTHWDREWYRTFQSFRARLVDAMDRVLDLIRTDPGFHFLLDGQSVVLEDYLEARPERRAELAEACHLGRIAIGPWYVQPDSLLPSGEAHVRNLLEGRRVGGQLGPVSTVAYTPDSFGHPAQFPQIFAGFGLEPFVYWRGNGNEIDALPAEYLWEAPDGSALLVHHLGEGYFAASGLPGDARAAARWLEALSRKLARRTSNDSVLLMNGIDHALPSSHTAAVAEALARATGWTVKRGLLEDFADGLSRDAPSFRGELLGGRVANLLPGVWSARMPLKLRNRRAESLLEGWAEPWSALARAFGAADEQPSLRAAWRALLKNQAHDSICGCSQDRVHEQMEARYDEAEELAAETTARVLERIAGLGPERRTPWSDTFDIAVFNPSPFPRTDVVRLPLDPSTWFEVRSDQSRSIAVHPLLLAALRAGGYTADGRPAHLIADPDAPRMRLVPDQPARSIEIVAEDVPAFGWRRIRLQPSDPHPQGEDEGRDISLGDMSVAAAEDGTLTVRIGSSAWSGLCSVEDIGDRGDAYDFDPVPGAAPRLDEVRVSRRVHANGIRHITVRRTFAVAAELAPDRERRDERLVGLQVLTEARLAPGVDRVDLRVRVDNTARDHRLRLLFPTGEPIEEFRAATTFDVTRRRTGARDATGWLHPAPPTFPQQGFVSANALTVGAPGLPEAEVTAEGVIAITLLRCAGWLSRTDLRSRRQLAGPLIPTPGAQCLQPIEAHLTLHAGLDPAAVRAAELGLRAVVAGEEPLAPPGASLLEIAPRDLLLSALMPADTESAIVLRLLNPTDADVDATVRLRFPVSAALSVRLDESPSEAPVSEEPVSLQDGVLAVRVPPHALRSFLLT